jgi:hypothetical protein
VLFFGWLPRDETASCPCDRAGLSLIVSKIVKMHGPHDEIVLQSSNFLICQPAFEKALFVWPNEHRPDAPGAGGSF